MRLVDTGTPVYYVLRGTVRIPRHCDWLVGPVSNSSAVALQGIKFSAGARAGFNVYKFVHSARSSTVVSTLSTLKTSTKIHLLHSLSTIDVFLVMSLPPLQVNNNIL